MINYSYSFDEKTGILYKTYFGPVKMADIESSWIYAFENNIIPRRTKGFILDYRDASFHITPEEHVEIVKFYQQHINVFRNKRIAIITESPKDVIIPMLIEEKDDGYHSKPFSTIEAAVKWILS
jgi:hypothetical protein